MPNEPFIDLDLERKVLRQIIFDQFKDTKEIEDEITSNIGYLVGLGEAIEIFKESFHRILFSEIIRIYLSHAQCVSRRHISRFIKKKDIEQEELEKRLIITDQIFAFEFEKKNFKILLEELRNNYYYRTLHGLNLEVNSTLRSIFEKKVNKTPGQIAQDVEDVIGKIILSAGKYTIIEEDIFKNIEADYNLLVEKREFPDKFKGIPTGFEPMDKALGGFFPGELTIVLGRPSQGKSILLLNFGYHAYNSNYNVIYVTLEMPLSQQKARFHSRLTNIDYHKLKIPRLLAEEELEYLKDKLEEEKQNHSNFYWFIDAPPNCSVAFVESRVLAFENLTGKKCNLLIVDPLYLMKPLTDPKDGDLVGQVAIDLKYISRKFNIPVIVASQINRSGGTKHQKGKAADTADAAFTDKIGQNADNMIFITGDRQRGQLEFPKTRDSSISKIFIIKKFDVMRFEYDKRSEEGQTEEDREFNKSSKE